METTVVYRVILGGREIVVGTGLASEVPKP